MVKIPSPAEIIQCKHWCPAPHTALTAPLVSTTQWSPSRLRRVARTPVPDPGAGTQCRQADRDNTHRINRPAAVIDKAAVKMRCRSSPIPHRVRQGQRARQDVAIPCAVLSAPQIRWVHGQHGLRSCHFTLYLMFFNERKDIFRPAAKHLDKACPIDRPELFTLSVAAARAQHSPARSCGQTRQSQSVHFQHMRRKSFFSTV